MADETYQTKIYTLQGGDERVYESGATLNLESGATVSMISGAVLGFAGQNVNAVDARRLIGSEFKNVEILASSTRLSVLNLPANVRFVIISGTSNLVSGSFWLTSVSAGREVFIQFGTLSTSTASAHIMISTSGCRIIGSCGTELSSILLYMSTASRPFLHLATPDDDVWAIVRQYGDINEQAVS